MGRRMAVIGVPVRRAVLRQVEPYADILDFEPSRVEEFTRHPMRVYH
jgi:hypothetical protein